MLFYIVQGIFFFIIESEGICAYGVLYGKVVEVSLIASMKSSRESSLVKLSMELFWNANCRLYNSVVLLTRRRISSI